MDLKNKAVYGYYEEAVVPETNLLDVTDGELLGRDPIYTGAGMLSSIYSDTVNVLNDNDYFGVVANMVINPTVYKDKKDIPLIGLYTYAGYGRGANDVISREKTPENIESLLVDYDDGDVSMMDIAHRFQEYNIAIYSTSSDTNGNKFRLLIEMDKPVHRDIFTFRDNQTALKEFFKGCDGTTFNWARYFHVPAVVEQSTNYSHVIHMGGKRISIFDDIKCTADIGDYKYRQTVEQKAKEKRKYSMKAKTSGNATYLTAIEDARNYMGGIAKFMEERGKGFDLHGTMLAVATTLTKAGLNATEGWNIVESTLIPHEYSVEVMGKIKKEFQDMFQG